MSLIELLTTLSSKGSVRLGVKEGMLPLILTVASYMVLQFSEMEKLEAHTQYIIVNDSDTYEHTVRNYCRAFLSQMIETFDDDAIQSIVFVAEKFLNETEEEAKVESISTDFENIDVKKQLYQST